MPRYLLLKMIKKKKLCGADWHSTLTEDEWIENILVMSKTCLLEEDHESDHKWTDDDEWVVSFK